MQPSNSKEIIITQDTVKRLVKDVKDIMKNPLTSQGIFYQHDESDMLKGYAMIIGPSETPYEDGFYFFEFNFPSNYPYSPPVVIYSTNIDYIEINKNAKSQRILSEIEEFMNQLFPNVDVRKYMWEHLASCLIGTNENQTFNIYTGSGANGKSKLVDLMTKCLGDYKGTVPLTLITQKRTSIGSTSDEIAQLKGTRMAVTVIVMDKITFLNLLKRK